MFRSSTTNLAKNLNFAGKKYLPDSDSDDEQEEMKDLPKSASFQVNGMNFTVFEEEESVSEMKNSNIMPTKCLFNIFLFLRLEELFNIFRTCQLFHRVSNSNIFWRNYYQSFSKSRDVRPSSNYKELFYVSRYPYKVKDSHFKKMLDIRKSIKCESFKVTLVGDSEVGKTAFLDSIRGKGFLTTRNSTIGVDHFIKMIRGQKNEIVKLQIMDTSGVEKYQSITTSYYKNSHGFFVCFDLTDKKSFLNLGKWIKRIEENASGKSPCLMVIGMKRDLVEEREVFYEDAKEFMKLLRLPMKDYCECSSLGRKYLSYPLGRMYDKIKGL